MIESFDNFTNRNINRYLKYYAFDWDDNILKMPTVIHMEHMVNDEWIKVDLSTSEFAKFRSTDDWRYPMNNIEKAMSNFRDTGPSGSSIFLEDTIKSINNGNYGPAWDDFIECITNGCIFAIITSRGHDPNSIRKSVEWIIDNILTDDQLYEMYNNLIRFSYIFGDKDQENDRILKGIPSKNELIKKYLDICDYIGISSPSRGGSPSNPEKAKEDALMEFNEKINNFAKNIGVKATIGFSDDDYRNVKRMEDLLDSITNEQFPYIFKYTIINTMNPSNITKKTKVIEKKLNETSEQTPGLESSILKFTQFGNMTGTLYPNDKDQRQDDYHNQFKRQTKYLSKISKDLIKTKKNKKPSK